MRFECKAWPRPGLASLEVPRFFGNTRDLLQIERGKVVTIKTFFLPRVMADVALWLGPYISISSKNVGRPL